MVASAPAAIRPPAECVVDYAAHTGESPVWSVAEQVLYWIDVEQPALHRFDPASGVDRHWLLPDSVGGLALQADRTRVLLGLRSGVHALQVADGALQRLASSPFDANFFRFNEVGCDPGGRLWLGTMYAPLPDQPPLPEAQQSRPWHVYTRAQGLRPRPDFATVPNGLAWSFDGRTMYAAHTHEGVIYAFDFECASGQFAARRVFATIDPAFGMPDGCTLDTEGCYWSALHGGGRLRRFRPDGSIDLDLLLPVRFPTMCAFGGPQLQDLYVTSAAAPLSAAQRSAEPMAGRLLRIRPGVRGRPPRLFEPTVGTAAARDA